MKHDMVDSYRVSLGMIHQSIRESCMIIEKYGMWIEVSKKLPEQNQLVVVQDQWLNIYVAVFKKILQPVCTCGECLICRTAEFKLFIDVPDVRSYSREYYEDEDKDWYNDENSLDHAYIDLWTEFPCIKPNIKNY